MPPHRMRNPRHPKENCTPASWTEYFDEAFDIPVVSRHRSIVEVDADEQKDSFRVYLKNFNGDRAPERKPFQRLDPNQLELSHDELEQYSKTPTLIALHGGGYSALTWCRMLHYLEQKCKCRFLALDIRGHGDTKTNDEERMDIDTLVHDTITVVHETHRICGFLETPKLVMIGHSMGGAIALHCSKKCDESLPSLVGLMIIDVVEGTAKEALPVMMSVIKSRPQRFKTLRDAIEYGVATGMADAVASACVSMPGNLVSIQSSRLAIHDVPLSSAIDEDAKLACDNLHKNKFHISLDQLLASSNSKANLPPRGLLPPRVRALKASAFGRMPIAEAPSIKEVDDDDRIVEATPGPSRQHEMQCHTIDDDGYRLPPAVDSAGYTWRTDLSKTQPFWGGWFEGLSEQFLSAPVLGKYLLLAEIGRLDKPLTIGQMQGKFMMKIFPKTGHAVHEYVPDQVANCVHNFLHRYRLLTTSADDQLPIGVRDY